MKKFVIIVMALLTVCLGFGSYWCMMYSLEQKGSKWMVVYLFCLVWWNIVVFVPLIGHWFKYWEEKLK